MSDIFPPKDSYNTLQPYLIHKNCAEALEFYKIAFGATERMRMTQPDGRIAHAEIQIGDSCVMMADEHPAIGAFSPEHYGGSPVSLHFYADDCDRVFKQAVSAGGKPEREPADQPYGERMAGVIDPSGYKWYVASPVKAPTGV
jgi:PhnB protein